MFQVQQGLHEAQRLPAPITNRAAGLIPGPRAMPLLGWRGNLLRYFNNPISCMTALRRNYGNIVRLTTGENKPLLMKPGPVNCYTVFGFGPDCNKEILSQPDIFQKRRPRGPETRTIKLLVNNVAMITSQQQKDQRRAIMPAFSRKHLELFYDPMVKSTTEVLDKWVEGETLLVFEEMLALSSRIAVRCIYGADPDSDQYGNLAVLMRDLNDVVFSPLGMIPVNLPGTPYRRGIDIGERVYQAVCAEIERKSAEGAEGFDVLSLMLRALQRNPDIMTREQLFGNAYMMYFAGYETSSLALAWTLFLLAQHPHVMSDLMDELDSELNGEPPTFSQIYELPLLDRVVKESMRVLGPTVAFPRYVASPTTLGPYEIPEGAEVMYSPYMTHLDADLYPEPKKFLPERWTKIKRTAYEYLPFGAGSRSCMGTSFASMQVRLVLPMLLQRFRLEVPDGSKMTVLAHTQMRPKNSLPMIVHAQDRLFHKSRADLRGNILEMVHLD